MIRCSNRNLEMQGDIGTLISETVIIIKAITKAIANESKMSTSDALESIIEIVKPALEREDTIEEKVSKAEELMQSETFKNLSEKEKECILVTMDFIKKLRGLENE